jgi:hypothetical protein
MTRREVVNGWWHGVGRTVGRHIRIQLDSFMR